MDNKEIARQAEVILRGMTLEQKLGQVQGMFCGGQVPPEILHKFPGGLGEIATTTSPATKEEHAKAARQEQDIIVEKCKIPALRHVEAVTGVLTSEAAVFPSAIGLGASWDPQMVKDMADLIRLQMVSIGMRHALSPVMDVARDPRWGRVGETYGEDPALCAAMSVAYTKGLQSEDLSQGAIATGKHFLGYGRSEGGLNMAANPIPERELREVYAKPFQAAISEANLGAIMNSYGVIDGEMIIGSENILHNLLREEMGFEGIVVSDYMSINKMVDLNLCDSPGNAGIRALKAGLDSELPMPYGYSKELLEDIKNHAELEAYLDRAVLRILKIKIKMELFENPAAKESLIEEAYDKERAEASSLKAARESIVLLKNDGILPLHKNIKRIAVIGPHADSIRLLFGCYTYPAALDRDMTGAMADMAGMEGISQRAKNTNEMPYLPESTVRASSPAVEEELRRLYGNRTLTIVEAIREKCPDAHIEYQKGCDVAGRDRSGFTAAVKAAENADIVIMVGGGKYGWGCNCTTGEGIDCDRIGLTGVQEKLAQKIHATGIPCVFVHMDAKPLSSAFISTHFSAVLENWFPGDTGGKALADVLFGDYNPAGRLPMTAARNTGQIPVYASQKNGSGYCGGKGMVLCKYVEGEKEPLHYFGEGLSYTTFEYSNLQVSETTRADGQVEVSCTVVNVGEIEGEEVVQLYVTDELASMVRPVQELAGFYRVGLKAGEAKRVHFFMKADQFAFLDSKMKWIVEAGKMNVRIGSSSKEARLEGSFIITDTVYIDGKKRGFYAKAWETGIE